MITSPERRQAPAPATAGHDRRPPLDRLFDLLARLLAIATLLGAFAFVALGLLGRL